MYTNFYEGIDYDEIYKALLTLKIKKLKINNSLIDKYKDMSLNPNFEQNHFSITSTGFYEIAHPNNEMDMLL